MLEKQKINIVWFKKNLRVSDNLALYEASLTGISVLPLYIVEPDYWLQPFASNNQWQFIHDSLSELRNMCHMLGQALVIRVGNTLEVLSKLQKAYHIISIFSHEETGNAWTYNRDKMVISWCQKFQIELIEFPNNGVVRRLKSRDIWSEIRDERINSSLTPTPVSLKPVHNIDIGVLPCKNDKSLGVKITNRVQPGGEKKAQLLLDRFADISHYKYMKSISNPMHSFEFCSRLSPHLANGVLSVKQAAHFIQNKMQHHKYTYGYKSLLSRLAWRCHFIQKLESQPEIEFECMHPDFEHMRNNNNLSYYKAWKNAETGYPFVDACMRSLQHHGWLNFRMRAMLSSFASYQLWLDWRIFSGFLASLFTDYEPGIHYSQLQMQSGTTGINVLRIYNPIKQSKEIDTNGDFIKKWIPELKNVPSFWIHEPWLMPPEVQKQSNCELDKNYPNPIVNNDEATKSAKEIITSVRKKHNFKNNSKKIYKKLGSRKKSTSYKKNKKDSKPSNQLGLFDDMV